MGAILKAEPVAIKKTVSLTQCKWSLLPDLGWKRGEAYLWPGRSGSQAEICLQGRARLEHDGGRLVLWAGGDRAVGGRAGRGLPLEELQDGLDVRRHLGLQSEGQARRRGGYGQW